jgi:chloramphenicol 3-O phosphotransferase
MQEGQIVILNGAPRAGKSSIVAVVQETFPGPWMNLGIDGFMNSIMPRRYWPGPGLRPGGERPDLEPIIPVFYAALYDSIAAFSRLGLNVIADVGHHDGYTKPLGILPDCARRLAGLPALFVGVRCSLGAIMERRNRGQPGREHVYERGTPDDPVPQTVRLFQEAVHRPGLYDVEVDTSMAGAAECADTIRRLIEAGVPSPTAFERIASGPSA